MCVPSGCALSVLGYWNPITWTPKGWRYPSTSPWSGPSGSTPSPRPLSHIGQFCDPILNAQQCNAGSQQNMGGGWSRVELYQERGLAVLVLVEVFNQAAWR